MTEQKPDVPISLASVTDRGLSEKRPLNEDSLLADKERRIFAVADGVGGAEAGEVASQTAIEVLDEAFRHQGADDDIEDLMEIAIQRANTSIHQMSREHSKLSMMATTIVALHLEGRRATIGHVGDSRLYRLAPDGRLYRETADHSIVEEEVRAGRMTPQQAATHPSRNVISRALGADTGVEVDMKTMEVEDGTVFLLCSDGITRHINDEEIREVIDNSQTLDAACEELKRRCFERGAEDNLTAVLIRVGEATGESAGANGEEEWDDERTLVAERPNPSATAKTIAMDGPVSQTLFRQSPAAPDGGDDLGSITLPPPSRADNTASANTTPASSRVEVPAVAASNETEARPVAKRSSAAGRVMKFVGYLLLLLAVGAVAFLSGLYYHRFFVDEPNETASASPSQVAPTPSSESAEASYIRRRREVDRDPTTAIRRMSDEMGGLPLNSNNPEFLYLYGRALLLSGKPQDAVQAFNKAVEKAEADGSAESGQLKLESRLATAAAMLRGGEPDAARNANRVLDDVLRAANTTADAPLPSATQTASPASLAPAPSP